LDIKEKGENIDESRVGLPCPTAAAFGKYVN
jgi:hypothetical protein